MQGGEKCRSRETDKTDGWIREKLSENVGKGKSERGKGMRKSEEGEMTRRTLIGDTEHWYSLQRESLCHSYSNTVNHFYLSSFLSLQTLTSSTCFVI